MRSDRFFKLVCLLVSSVFMCSCTRAVQTDPMSMERWADLAKRKANVPVLEVYGEDQPIQLSDTEWQLLFGTLSFNGKPIAGPTPRDWSYKLSAMIGPKRFNVYISDRDGELILWKDGYIYYGASSKEFARGIDSVRKKTDSND